VNENPAYPSVDLPPHGRRPLSERPQRDLDRYNRVHGALVALDDAMDVARQDVEWLSSQVSELHQRIDAVLALHQETEYRYEDDADVACTVCGVVTEWPCLTVTLLTAWKPDSGATP
jgi:hypothetical protein